MDDRARDRLLQSVTLNHPDVDWTDDPFFGGIVQPKAVSDAAAALQALRESRYQ
jgi:hypothetical protein